MRLKQALRLLDHRWLTRASNGAFLVGAGVFAGTKVIDALNHVEWLTVVGVVLMAFGSIRLLLEHIGKRRLRSEVDNSRLFAAVYGEEQKERERRARQMAKENVDREAKI